MTVRFSSTTLLSRLVVVAVLGLTLQACSALNPTSAVKALKPDPTFDIQTQVGRENTQNRSLVDVRSSTSVDQSGVQNANSSEASGVQSADWSAHTIMVNQSNEQPIGFLYLFLLIAGWILPDPISVYRSIKCKIKRIRRRRKQDDKAP